MCAEEKREVTGMEWKSCDEQNIKGEGNMGTRETVRVKERKQFSTLSDHRERGKERGKMKRERER